jgi:menaquinone-dependent protoporphyrinogen oxidase
MTKVLIAYASVYGSTREVAEKVAELFTQRGIETVVRPAEDVDSLEGISAVVLGGALYFFRLHKKARRFLSQHRKALQDLPFAVFGMGPTNDVEKEFTGARKHLAKSLDKYRQISPVAIQVFGGKLDPKALRFPHTAMKALPASDIRDWEAIRAWAQSLPVALGLDAPPD